MTRSSGPPPDRGGGFADRAAALPAGVQRLLQDAAGAVSARVHLLALELRRARDVLPRIIALLVLAAVVALTAWLAFWAGLAMVLVDAGWPPAWTLAAIVAVNALLAGLLAWRAVAMVPLLALPATLHHLTVGRPGRAADGATPPLPEAQP